MRMSRMLLVGTMVAALATCFVVTLEAQTSAAPTELRVDYGMARRLAVPGEGDFDYVAIDGPARRVYVSHGDLIQVLDADSGKVVGQISAPGAHGVAIAPEFHRGFTSNGADNSVTIFDTNTLAPIKTVKLEVGTDGIVYDPFTKRVFPLSEKITVIDAQTGDIAGTVKLDAKHLEAGLSDGKGTVYVNEADKGAVAVIDPTTLAVTKTYPVNDCTSPHTLSFDADTQRLFVGCRSSNLVALDATTGKVVGSSLMCAGVDSSGFDPDNKLIFESCSEGAISVIREFTPDSYQIIRTIPTELWAKTMAFDPTSKNIYLSNADFEFVPLGGPHEPPTRQLKKSSFHVLVVEKK